IFEASITFFNERISIFSSFVNFETSPILLNWTFIFAEEINEAEKGSGEREWSSCFSSPEIPLQIFETTVSLSKPRLLKILLYETKVFTIFLTSHFLFPCFEKLWLSQ